MKKKILSTLKHGDLTEVMQQFQTLSSLERQYGRDEEGNNCLMLLVIRGEANVLSALFDYIKSEEELLTYLCEAQNNDKETAWSLAFKNPQKDIVGLLIKNIPKTAVFCQNILSGSVKPYASLLFEQLEATEVATNQTLLLALIHQTNEVDYNSFRARAVDLVIKALRLFASTREACDNFLNQIDQKLKEYILLYAASTSSTGLLELLLNEPEQKPESEPLNTSLQQSFARGKVRISVVQKINKQSCLMFACQTQNLDAVILLIKEARKRKGEEGVFSFVNQVDQDGNTALHHASTVNASACADYLLLNGYANCRAMNNDGDTALLIAVKKNHVNTLKILLARGNHEIVLINNHLGENVVSLLRNNDSADLKTLFSDVLENLEPKNFLDACRTGNTNKIMSQLETTNFSKHINSLDEDGNNCLMILVIHDHVDALLALFDGLKNQENILSSLCEAKNTRNQTAWSLALADQKKQVIKILLEHMPKTEDFYKNILPNNMQADRISWLKGIVESMPNQDMASNLLRHIEALEREKSTQTQGLSSAAFYANRRLENQNNENKEFKRAKLTDLRGG